MPRRPTIERDVRELPPLESGAGVAAVERALSILTAFDRAGDSLSLTELSRKTGLYKSTALRIFASLERFAFVTRLESGRYQLGPALQRLGGQYERSLHLDQHVLPTLEDLMQASGESAAFYVRQGDLRQCLLRVDSAQSLRHNVRAGDTWPVTNGASGKVLLAFERGGYETPAHAFATIAMTSLGEQDPHLAAVAVPVFGIKNVLVGALSVSGPRSRFDASSIARFSTLLLAATQSLTARLGGDVNSLITTSGVVTRV